MICPKCGSKRPAYFLMLFEGNKKEVKCDQCGYEGMMVEWDEEQNNLDTVKIDKEG